MTRAAVLATVATATLARPTYLLCDRCTSTGWLRLVDGEQLCVDCAPNPKRAIPAPEPTAMGCGCCDRVVALADLRWRNRRALLLGCRFCTPKEDR